MYDCVNIHYIVDGYIGHLYSYYAMMLVFLLLLLYGVDSDVYVDKDDDYGYGYHREIASRSPTQSMTPILS